MSLFCSVRHFLNVLNQARYGGAPCVRLARAAAGLGAVGALILLASSSPLVAQSQVLQWAKADATGRAAWRVVVEEMPELAADAKKFRFDVARNLRQAIFDLDGDGHPEILLSGTIDTFCGSAGCMMFVLTRGSRAKWKIVCETYAHFGSKHGDIRIETAGESGWRNFSATSRVTWRKAEDGAVSCEEQAINRL